MLLNKTNLFLKIAWFIFGITIVLLQLYLAGVEGKDTLEIRGQTS